MISILLPSRGRPTNLGRLLLSLAETTDEEWEAVVRLDDDEPHREAYKQAVLGECRFITGKRATLSGYWDECAANARGDILMMGADDIVFRTPNWDRIVRNAFPSDGIALVHGDDLGDRGRSYATHGFVRQEWVRAAGEFVPPIFVSDFADRWLNDIANMIDRRIYVPVIIEHLHPGFGKAALDDTYRERIVRHQQHDPDGIYRRSVRDRMQTVERLLAVMR